MFVAFSGLHSASTAPQQHLRTDWFSCLAPASTPKISWLLCAQKLSSFSFMDVPPITHVRHGTCSLQHSYNDIISYRSLHHHHWTTLPPWRRGRLLPLSSWLWKPGTSWQLIMVSVWFAGWVMAECHSRALSSLKGLAATCTSPKTGLALLLK